MRQTVKITAYIVVLVSLSTTGSAVAGSSGLRWLDYSPVRYFTDQDWELAKAAGRRALDDTQDGVTVAWTNPKSKNHGSLTPLNTRIDKDTTCRSLKIVNHANNLHGHAVYEFCKQPDGTWAAVQKSAAQESSK